ncbi:MAG: NAD-dependent epimerase/dehydratase family protein [Pseudobdellovibrionaceae bacterium]
MQTAVVTGAGGFLGSHLTEKLVQQGFQVIAVDNFCTGSRKNKSILDKNPHVTFIEADVIKPFHVWLEHIHPDWLKNLKYVFHFASAASPPLYQKLNIETMWVNSLGLENCLLLANQYKAKVIFASTSEVYGDPNISPQPENYWGYVNSFGVRSCYDEAKRFGESLIFSYNQRFATRHGLVRIFNTYGPRINPNDGRVVINFLLQALKSEPLTVYGDGSQTRSFCYVSDLIEGIYKYATNDITEPVNIGNPTEFSILDLAHIVQKMFADKNLSIEFKDLPGDDPKQRKPDISKAGKLLNWQPQISLQEGLNKMTDWLRTEI